jgi:HAD superfamily hydrolase (TIGR01549 family)
MPFMVPKDPIDAVIFDIGNVLLTFDYLIAARRLMEKNNLAEIPDRALIVERNHAYECGQLSRAGFLEFVRGQFKDEGLEEHFVEIWQDIFEPNAPMVELVERLAPSKPLYLLSNVGCIHQEFIFRRYPFFSLFRDGVYSYRAGCLKPDRRIFEIAAKQFDVEPGRTLFIDDMPENVEGARSAGFEAIQYDFRNHEALMDQLAERGAGSSRIPNPR